ncbi:antibiotic biosynthesis monooxygenase family protein [Pseudomonas sp. NA-150]|uniref:antibiotic biosynthesis monooxygenase family protein n=1 Tax=Pseudomonas sp. NA-150 TaxID=3367525 RepID=UPI0037C7FEAD
MFIAAINTIQVQAITYHSDALIGQLAGIVETLRETSECLAYRITRSDADPLTWVITGHWQSQAAMKAHFQHPALTELMGLLQCNVVRGIQLDSFVVR